MRFLVAAVLAFFLMLFPGRLFGTKAEVVTFLPINCAELIPDNAPFVGYFNAVARGTVQTDAAFSRRILRILALREKVLEHNALSAENNPIDWLIRKTLCYYREQKEPTRPIPYDDAKIREFIKGALGELEAKVESAIYQMEFEVARRKAYEEQLAKNQRIIRNLENDARQKARKSYNRISDKAKKQASQP